MKNGVSIVNQNEVNLYYNYIAHSKIIKNFDEFTDYHSEDEYMNNWEFDWKNNQLKFVKLHAAG